MNGNLKKIVDFTVVISVIILIALESYIVWLKNSVKIAPKPYEEKMTACLSLPNGSVQKIAETTRIFINLPRDVYPNRDYNLKFIIADGNATAGWISNAGPYGEAFQSTPDCWSYYYEFDGKGEIDLNVKSAINGMPDYFVRFIVGSEEGPEIIMR